MVEDAGKPRPSGRGAVTKPMDKNNNQHMKRDVWCNDCGWIGITGELVISHPRPGLLCPQCKSSNIHQPVADAPTGIQ